MASTDDGDGCTMHMGQRRTSEQGTGSKQILEEPWKARGLLSAGLLSGKCNHTLRSRNTWQAVAEAKRRGRKRCSASKARSRICLNSFLKITPGKTGSRNNQFTCTRPLGGGCVAGGGPGVRRVGARHMDRKPIQINDPRAPHIAHAARTPLPRNPLDAPRGGGDFCGRLRWLIA